MGLWFPHRHCPAKGDVSHRILQGSFQPWRPFSPALFSPCDIETPRAAIDSLHPADFKTVSISDYQSLQNSAVLRAVRGHCKSALFEK